MLSRLVVAVGDKYGGMFYDKEAGRTWDVGQALCRAVYGPKWYEDPKRSADDDPNKPAPAAMFAEAEKWLRGELPDWVLRLKRLDEAKSGEDNNE